jgi:lipid-A-disaccharide synthase
VKATYVGNPLADSLLDPRPDAARSALGLDPKSPVLAVLPGSRRQEIVRLWPRLLAAARRLRQDRPSLQLVVPVAPTIDRSLLGLAPDVVFVEGRAPEVLAAADAALVASGTATLQAALARTPMVVVYRVNWLTWWIGRLLVRVRSISLPNLLSGGPLVPELLQSECTAERIAAAAAPLLDGGPERKAQLEGLDKIRDELAPRGSPGAARRAAEEVVALLEAPR